MISKSNLERLYLISAAIGVIGYFTLTEQWMKIASIFLFVVGAILLIR